jgi:HEAT repeat protein
LPGKETSHSLGEVPIKMTLSLVPSALCFLSFFCGNSTAGFAFNAVSSPQLKRRLVIAAIATLVLAIAAILLVRDERQFRLASHNGKTVKEWASELYLSYDPRTTNAATAAFVVMGSNAVPALRALVKSREPIYERTFLQQARRIPVAARQYLFQKLRPGRLIEYRLGAVRALAVLGPIAAPALPELIETFSETNSPIRWAAAQTIPALGPQAISALAILTTNSVVNVRHTAIYALGEARTNALPAAPLLVRATMDTNQAIRGSAFYSLSRIGQTALPVTVEMAATDPDPDLRNAAFRSLIVLLPPPGRVSQALLVSSTNNAEMRRLAILSLSRSRLTNDHAMTLFQTALDDKDASVREAAERALKYLKR